MAQSPHAAAAAEQQSTSPQLPGGLVYYLDAALEGALASSDSPLAEQPQRVRFGPFESPLWLGRDTLEVVSGEEIIGYFGGSDGTWTIDGLRFTSLTIAVMARGRCAPERA